MIIVTSFFIAPFMAHSGGRRSTRCTRERTLVMSAALDRS